VESMYFLIPISFLFVALAIGLYIWAVHSGQYDDLDVEGQRILFDPDETPKAQPPQPQPAASKESQDT
jgi:cbb3-type cytochrome oxidase maturation protein